MSAQKSNSKIALTAPQTIPLDKLEIHEDNVRKSAEDQAAIEDLAADIVARGLLQSLSVRPILDDDGNETGRYGIQAGSRRFRALKLLVKQKKLAKNAPIPCIVKTDGYAEADSLAENTQREALTPLDEFRAFKAMADKGHGDDTIAAAFRVSILVVRQRLRLANASPIILEAYEKDELSLEQLMAYCLTDNHARQEQVFEALTTYWNKGTDQIRRLLTEKSVSVDDKRALFIGTEAYQAAGGAIERDLFGEDADGYMIDVPLVEKLVAEKLAAEADNIRAEGWAWVETAIDFPWNHHRDYRAIKPIAPALSDDEQEEYENLDQERDEYDAVAEDDWTDEDRARVTAIKAKLAEFDARSDVYSEAQKAKSGVFVSLDDDGTLHVERGYRRNTDIAAEAETRAESAGPACPNGVYDHGGAPYETGEPDCTPSGEAMQNDDDGAELPDKLLIELTAYHSLGLRNALAREPSMATFALLHAMVLKLFYQYNSDSCLQIEAKDNLVPAFPGMAEFRAAKDIKARHEAFQKRLPEQPHELWDSLIRWTAEDNNLLFAHCVGLTINALYEPFARGSNKRRAAIQLGQAIRLDMNEEGFTTNAGNYFGRIKKQQILETVAEVKGEQTAELLADHKKKDMAAEAERLLAGTGWLPEPLRTPVSADDNADATLPAFLDEAA